MGGSVPLGAPMWGSMGWAASPSDVGLKQPCPGSLLCKGRICLRAAPGLSGVTTESWEHPNGTPWRHLDGGWPWPHLAKAMSLQAPVLPCLVFASKLGFDFCCQKTAAVFSSLSLCPAPGPQHPTHGLNVPPVASSCKPRGPTAHGSGQCCRLQHLQAPAGKVGVKSHRKKCIFLHLPGRFTGVFRAELRGHLECHPQPLGTQMGPRGIGCGTFGKRWE